LRTFETVVASRTSPRKAHVAKSFYLQRRRRLRDARYCSPDESCQHIGNDKSREVWRNPFRPTAQGSVTADDFTKSSSTKSVGPIGGYIFCVSRVNAAGVPKKDDRPRARRWFELPTGVGERTKRRACYEYPLVRALVSPENWRLLRRRRG